jgi:hypothetical protein
MGTLTVILFVLAMWHFVYESLLLPTIRLKYRYKLFELRDQLRRLSIKNDPEINKDVLGLVDHAISTSISRLPFLSITLLFSAKKTVLSNEALRKKVEKQLDDIKACKSREVQDIFDLTTKYSGSVVIANSGGWIPYLMAILIPVLFVLTVFKLTNMIKKSLRKYVQGVYFTPEKDLSMYYTATKWDLQHC